MTWVTRERPNIERIACPRPTKPAPFPTTSPAHEMLRHGLLVYDARHT